MAALALPAAVAWLAGCAGNAPAPPAPLYHCEYGITFTARFIDAQHHWLDDYALFMTIDGRHGGRSWQEWPAPLVRRERIALHELRRIGRDDIAFWQFVQWVAEGLSHDEIGQVVGISTGNVAVRVNRAFEVLKAGPFAEKAPLPWR